MVNYQLGKIYKLTSIHTAEIYIGSTTEDLLCKRLRGHKSHYNQFLKGNFGKITSFEILKYGDVKIELIEAYPCNTKDELSSREGYWIRELDCVNRKIQGRTKEEWYNENKEYMKEYRKEYRKENKVMLSTQQTEKINCECGCILSRTNLSTHRKSPKHLRLINLKKDVKYI